MFENIISLGSLIGTGLTLAGSVAALLMVSRKVRREHDGDVEGKIAPVRSDVADIKTRISDFMPRSEIMLVVEGVEKVADKAGDGVVDLRVAMKGIETRQDSTERCLVEIRDTLRDQGRETRASLDRITDSIAQLSRSAA